MWGILNILSVVFFFEDGGGNKLGRSTANSFYSLKSSYSQSDSVILILSLFKLFLTLLQVTPMTRILSGNVVLVSSSSAVMLVSLYRDLSLPIYIVVRDRKSCVLVNFVLIICCIEQCSTTLWLYIYNTLLYTVSLHASTHTTRHKWPHVNTHSHTTNWVCIHPIRG